MDDTTIQSLERLFYEKIMLYNDLLHSLKRERESLIDIDLEKLWQVSRDKDEICRRLKSLRQEIISIICTETDQDHVTLGRIPGLIPREKRAQFEELTRTLIGLKREVEVLRKENMSYIDDSLRFLDEMLSIIAGESKSNIYNEKCHLRKPGANIFLCREA